MPKHTSTDGRSWIQWDWLNEPAQRINPDSLTWSLDNERAGPLLLEILTKNDDIAISGGEVPEDLRSYYDGVILGLAELHIAFPSIMFDLPPLDMDLPDGAIL